jgi:nicotinamide-nucleotide amidase
MPGSAGLGTRGTARADFGGVGMRDLGAEQYDQRRIVDPDQGPRPRRVARGTRARPWSFWRDMSASFPAALTDTAERIVRSARSLGRTVATVESCTAGALACLLSDAEGATDAFHGGFVVYTKAAKSAVVGVSPGLIERHTAVSREVALAMARGGLERMLADVVVAVTGVAGPEPDEDGNEVGLVHVAAVSRQGAERHLERRFGPRPKDEIVQQAMLVALALLSELLA